MKAGRIWIGLVLLSVAFARTPSAFAQDKLAVQPVLGFEAANAPAKLLPPTTAVDGKPKVDAEKPAPILVETFNGSTQPWWGRVSLRADVGDGVGYSRGYTYVEGMFPILEAGKALSYVDVRAVNFDQENRWELNLGAGHRWYSPRCDCIFGINSFLDMRKTEYHTYKQLGVGFEALTPTLEFRVNGYFILGANHYVVADTGIVALGTIANNNFLFQRIQTVETAMGGLDAEFGGRIPYFECFAPKVFAGFYTYSSEGTQTAVGVRGRFEAQVTDRIVLHGQIQNDAHFGTTVSGGLALYFGPPSGRSAPGGRPTWEDVLRQRVQRDVNVVIAQTTTTTNYGIPVPPPPPPPPPPPIEEEG